MVFAPPCFPEFANKPETDADRQRPEHHHGQTTEADARELHSIRNALEHTYLRVSEGWAKPFMINGVSNNGFGIVIGSDELEAKAIRVMQMARSALFYVSFAIGVEERKKQLANPGQFIGSMPLYGLDDRRRCRDPF